MEAPLMDCPPLSAERNDTSLHRAPRRRHRSRHRHRHRGNANHSSSLPGRLAADSFRTATYLGPGPRMQTRRKTHGEDEEECAPTRRALSPLSHSSASSSPVLSPLSPLSPLPSSVLAPQSAEGGGVWSREEEPDFRGGVEAVSSRSGSIPTISRSKRNRGGRWNSHASISSVRSDKPYSNPSWVERHAHEEHEAQLALQREREEEARRNALRSSITFARDLRSVAPAAPRNTNQYLIAVENSLPHFSSAPSGQDFLNVVKETNEGWDQVVDEYATMRDILNEEVVEALRRETRSGEISTSPAYTPVSGTIDIVTGQNSVSHDDSSQPGEGNSNVPDIFHKSLLSTISTLRKENRILREQIALLESKISSS